MDSAALESDQGSPAEIPYAIPWESPNGHNASGFFRTLSALVRDVRAFSRGFPSGNIQNALGFLALVELLWMAADTLTHAVLAEHPLVENLKRQLGLVGGLAFVGLCAAAIAHLVARSKHSDARLSDAVRVFAYATASYSLLRIAILPLFALRLESRSMFGEIAFVLWIGPTLFAAVFVVLAMRARYRTSLLRILLAAIVLPVLIVSVASVLIDGPH